MATYTKELSTQHNFPNIDIYIQYCDGVFNGYEAVPQAGYVMYSPAKDVMVERDPETDEEVTNTYYCRLVILPLNYNFNNFDYIAVLENDIRK